MIVHNYDKKKVFQTIYIMDLIKRTKKEIQSVQKIQLNKFFCCSAN